MSRRSFIKGKKLASAQSLAADFSSDSTVVLTVDNVGYIISTAGVTDNTGVFQVWIRIKNSDNENEQSEWAQLTLSAVPTLADDDDVFFINLNQLPPCEAQVRYVAAGGVLEIQTLTLPTKAGSTDGDYIVVYAQDGTTWAVALDKTGLAAATPTGAAWLAADYKVYLDISGATTAANVAALVNTALNLLTGFTAAITSVDAGAGAITLTQISAGPTTNPAPHNKNDSGVGTILGVQSTAGVSPDGTCDIWLSGTAIGG